MGFLITLLALTAIILGLLVRSKIRADVLDKQMAHRSNHSLIHSNTSEAGHSHTYVVTKDAIEYAKIFVPDTARRS